MSSRPRRWPMTPVRRAVLAQIECLDRPLSIPEIHERIALPVSRMSVYRTVATLVARGKLVRLDFEEGFYRYDRPFLDVPRVKNYLCCLRCRRIEIDESSVVDLSKIPQSFRVACGVLRTFGVCDLCQKRHVVHTIRS